MDAARYFKQRTPRWSFWLCEDYLDVHDLRRSRATLADFGLRPISHPPGMIADTLTAPRGPLPELEIQPVEKASQQRSFAEITALAFDIPYPTADTVYAHPQAWKGDYKGYLGIAEGRVVTIAAAVETADAIGVYSLATHPWHRRKGYAEALLRGVVEHVRSSVRACGGGSAAAESCCNPANRDIRSTGAWASAR